MSDRTDDRETATDGGTTGLLSRIKLLARMATMDLAETDERVRDLDSAERRNVERHSLGNRISHWLQVLLFGLLLWTGLAIWTGFYVPFTLFDSGTWGGYYIAFGIHMWTGILTLAITFVIFPLYYVVNDNHRQLLELADIQVGFSISKAFVGLIEYMPYYHEARRAYDDEEDDWIAHHPMQKTFFWWIAIFIGVLALTGFALYYEMAADPAWWIGTLGFLSGLLAMETLKQVHLFLAFVTAAMVAFHIYFAVIPSNWDILHSMVYGDVRAYVVGRKPRDHIGDEGPSGGEQPTPAAVNGGEVVEDGDDPDE